MQLIRQLLGLFAVVFKLLSDRQLLNAGKSEQAVKDAQEVLDNVEQAKEAVAAADPVHIERLRDRFDRSRRK